MPTLFDKAPIMPKKDPTTGELSQYVPRQPGLLTGIGRMMSGFSAPYVGDMQWAVKQQQLQQQADQADQEFQRYMMQTGTGKPIFTIDPETNQVVPLGVVPKGSQVMAPQYTPEEKTKQAIQKSELTSAAQMLPKMDQAFEAVKSLKDQYYKSVKPPSVGAGDVKGGLAARAQGLMQGGMSAVGANPELNVFKSDRGAFASLISKGGFLEAGVLTNQDITRVLQSIPDEGSTEKEATGKWNRIEEILSKARSKYESKLGKLGGSKQATSETQQFNVDGKVFNIPADKVEAFKKAKGIK